MRRSIRRLRLVMVMAVAVLFSASASVSHALWSDSQTIGGFNLPRSAVMFSSWSQAGEEAQYASAQPPGRGDPVVPTTTVTLPGSVIAKVMSGPPVIWRFYVAGYASGQVGMAYDISFTIPAHDNPANQTLGVYDRVIEGSTMAVFPATGSGDCLYDPQQDPPAVGFDQAGQVNMIASTVLQPPGAYNGKQQQTWCVRLEWVADPPKTHINQAKVVAYDDQNRRQEANDFFKAKVTYLPSLDPEGLHINIARVKGTGENGVTTHDTASWRAVMYPDPTREPDITLTLTPRVLLPGGSSPS